MKCKAQSLFSEDGQHTLDQYAQVLQRLEDLSPVTTRNHLSDLRQFIAWCECSWRDAQEDHSFLPQAVAPSLLMRYRDYLQTALDLKPSTVNRTLMSLKRYFAWTRKTRRSLTGRALGHLVTKYATQAQVPDLSPHDLRHRFGYRMAEVFPLHRLAQIMGHDSLDTTMLYIRGTKQDLQQDVEKIAWI